MKTNKAISLVLAATLFFTACKPFENNISLAPFHPPVLRGDISFSYSSNQLENPNLHLKKNWAKRKNIQVLNIKIINNSEQAIHGTQFQFLSGGKPLKLVNNELACEKLGTRKFPKAVYIIPIAIVGIVLYAALMAAIEGDDDGYFEEDEDWGPRISSSKQKDKLEGLNKLQKGLYSFNIALHTLYPGEKLEGLIAFESATKIEELDIKVKEVGFRVIAPTR